VAMAASVCVMCVAGTTAAVAVPVGGSAAVTTTVGATADADSTINGSLDSLAGLFAAAVTDAGLRQSIHDGAAERFDGDTNVLYKTLSSTSNVNGALSAAYATSTKASGSAALEAVKAMVSDVPRLQVAVPVNFDAWDPAKFTPLVAFMPVGVDDTTLKTVTAYDATGKAHVLDAQVDPTEPVIVLSVNERTDEAGNLVEAETVPEDNPVVEDESSLAGANYEVRLKIINLYDDKEPWAKGAAEISMKAKGAGLLYSDNNWVNLDHSGDAWFGSRVLGTATNDVRFVWWEDDASGTEVTLNYRDVGLTFKISDEDDQIGSMRIDHSTFQGATGKWHGWSALDQMTD